MEVDDKKLERAAVIGGLFDSWGKILAAIVIAIIGIATTYYQINDNSGDIELLKADKENAHEREDMLFERVQEGYNVIQTEIKEDNEIRDARSDKRYNRAMGVAEELKAENLRLRQALTDLLQRVSRIEGALEYESPASSSGF